MHIEKIEKELKRRFIQMLVDGVLAFIFLVMGIASDGEVATLFFLLFVLSAALFVFAFIIYKSVKKVWESGRVCSKCNRAYASQIAYCKYCNTSLEGSNSVQETLHEKR